MDYVVHGILQARILEWVAFPFSRGSSQPRSSAMQVDSLPAEPQGKPKNTGVDSLSLLQRILLTQELNWGLLHCRWILYQLSYSLDLLLQSHCLIHIPDLYSILHSYESESESRSVVSNSLRPHGLYSPWNSRGQNTGVSSLSLLQGIFPTQG